jgi:cyclopropane fatty-acyl-phospholipid synthase-like methyltransferase
MTKRRPIWDWACDYVGDPSSWSKRGALILELLVECGMTHTSHVLNIGCGNLSEGTPIIRMLEPGRYVGIEPNGWLVEAALERDPSILDRDPEFLWRTDFDASELGRTFDFVVSHSVLSHCAHWQLPQFLTATRKVVNEGAVMLASFRNDQYNSHHEEWVYPGVSTFRLPLVQALGWQCGWHVEMVHSYRDRMMKVAPNDAHDWLRCIAVPSIAEMNDLRLAEEAVEMAERDVRERNAEISEKIAGEADDQAIRDAGMIP